MQETINKMLKARGHSNPKSGVKNITLSIPLNEPTLDARLDEVIRFFRGQGFDFITKNSTSFTGTLAAEFIMPARMQVDHSSSDPTPRMLYIPEEERESVLFTPVIKDFLRRIGAKIIFDRMFSYKFFVSLDPTTDYQKSIFNKNIQPYIDSRPSDFYHGR